jgi:enoyl-CoA hydratase
MPDYQTIIYEKANAVAALTLNRPAELNPLDDRTVAELHACFDAIDADRELEIVVLRGAGRAFSAGGDLKKALSLHRDVDWMAAMGYELRRLLQRIEESELLVIAVVDGLCVAGGIELILACDLVIASERARFSDGHLNFSLLPGAGGTQRLPRQVGPLRAKELLLTARTFDGQEAAAMQLVTRCIPTNGLDRHVTELIANLLEKSFSSRKAIKQLVNRGLKLSREDGLAMEAGYVLKYETTHPDAHEGLVAFSEKRKPRFRSRRES